MAETTESTPNVASPGKEIQELLDANKAVMDGWYAQKAIEQRAKADEIVKAVLLQRDAGATAAD